MSIGLHQVRGRAALDARPNDASAAAKTAAAPRIPRARMTYDRTVPIRTVLNSRVPIKVWTRDVEESAAKQLVNTGALPFVFKHVAAMADTHWGMGATVGSVIATKGAICPAAVGVDIGCGMARVKTSLAASALEGKLPELRHSIERSIPVGFHQRKEPHTRGEDFLAKAG